MEKSLQLFNFNFSCFNKQTFHLQLSVIIVCLSMLPETHTETVQFKWLSSCHWSMNVWIEKQQNFLCPTIYFFLFCYKCMWKEKRKKNRVSFLFFYCLAVWKVTFLFYFISVPVSLNCMSMFDRSWCISGPSDVAFYCLRVTSEVLPPLRPSTPAAIWPPLIWIKVQALTAIKCTHNNTHNPPTCAWPSIWTSKNKNHYQKLQLLDRGLYIWSLIGQEWKPDIQYAQKSIQQLVGPNCKTYTLYILKSLRSQIKS